MTLSGRRPRAVYRVCGEDEYLAGVDPFANWHAVPAAKVERGRVLRRFAGAAALTGAVVTVGGAVSLVGLRGRSADRREIAERFAPPAMPAGSRRSASVAHATHRHVANWSRPRRGRPVGRAPLQGAPAAARRGETPPAVETPARTIAVSAPQPAPARRQAPVASAAQSAPAATEPRPRAQSEFGFER